MVILQIRYNCIKAISHYELIVLGEGGSGKSFLVQVISQAADKILRKSGDDPKRPKVILSAPTGIAAMLIGMKIKLFIKITC